MGYIQQRKDIYCTGHLLYTASGTLSTACMIRLTKATLRLLQSVLTHKHWWFFDLRLNVYMIIMYCCMITKHDGHACCMSMFVPLPLGPNVDLSILVHDFERNSKTLRTTLETQDLTCIGHCAMTASSSKHMLPYILSLLMMQTCDATTMQMVYRLIDCMQSLK